MITHYGKLFTATITRPSVSVPDVLASNIRGAGRGDDCTGPDFGDGLVGRGRLLAFTTWTIGRCASPPSQDRGAVVSTVLWRVVDRGGGACPLEDGPGPPSMCVKVADVSGRLVPFDVDAGRILVLRGTKSIELLDQKGNRLRGFTSTAPPLAAVLTGSTLAVLVQGALQVYDTETGALTHSWPLRDVSSGRRCGLCPLVRLQLVAAGRGLALYLLDGKAHLLRLRDGRDVTVDRAVAADLTSEGLFYTFRMSGRYHGRVRFIPYAKLPLRSG